MRPGRALTDGGDGSGRAVFVSRDAGGCRRLERERLDKEIAKLEKELDATVRKLSNASFVEKAPPDVVAEHKQRKIDFAEKLKQLRAARASLG